MQVDLGTLSMMDFPGSYKKSLMQTVRDVVSSNEGTSCAFACIQAANEWLALETWRDINVNITHSNHPDPLVAKGDGSSLNVSGEVVSTPLTLIREVNTGWRQKSEIEIEREDKREEEYVKLATTEACQCAAVLMRRRSSHMRMNNDESVDLDLKYNTDDLHIRNDEKMDNEDIDQDCTSAPSASARGLWSYTVGLIGKPSAGKSTFFNAATHAVLRGADGRKMADVAPHPFTTIEPNVGPGWFGGPVDDLCGRVSPHGRDTVGRRVLPCMIKDVAGLVPGAYKGRG
jgi:hypothetical protein